MKKAKEKMIIKREKERKRGKKREGGREKLTCPSAAPTLLLNTEYWFSVKQEPVEQPSSTLGDCPN